MQGDANRKTVIWSCAALIAITCLFPPWVSPRRVGGYGWFFHPPDNASHVDLTRLVVEWVFVAVIGLALYAAGPPLWVSQDDWLNSVRKAFGVARLIAGSDVVFWIFVMVLAVASGFLLYRSDAHHKNSAEAAFLRATSEMARSAYEAAEAARDADPWEPFEESLDESAFTTNAPTSETIGPAVIQVVATYRVSAFLESPHMKKVYVTCVIIHHHIPLLAIVHDSEDWAIESTDVRLRPDSEILTAGEGPRAPHFIRFPDEVIIPFTPEKMEVTMSAFVNAFRKAVRNSEMELDRAPNQTAERNARAPDAFMASRKVPGKFDRQRRLYEKYRNEHEFIQAILLGQEPEIASRFVIQP
jgi:hypothetical protein